MGGVALGTCVRCNKFYSPDQSGEAAVRAVASTHARASRPASSPVHMFVRRKHALERVGCLS